MVTSSATEEAVVNFERSRSPRAGFLMPASLGGPSSEAMRARKYVSSRTNY